MQEHTVTLGLQLSVLKVELCSSFHFTVYIRCYLRQKLLHNKSYTCPRSRPNSSPTIAQHQLSISYMPETKYSSHQVPIYTRRISPDISGRCRTQYSCCAGYIRQLAVKRLTLTLTLTLTLLTLTLTLTQMLTMLTITVHRGRKITLSRYLFDTVAGQLADNQLADKPTRRN